MNLSKLRDDIEQVTKKAMSHESHRVIVDVSQLTGWLNVLNNELGTSPRVVDEHSTDMCAACGTDLATCETIWAAEGILYCSRECGIHDFKVHYGDDAERHFDEVAEEINPRDIGIK